MLWGGRSKPTRRAGTARRRELRADAAWLVGISVIGVLGVAFLFGGFSAVPISPATDGDDRAEAAAGDGEAEPARERARGAEPRQRGASAVERTKGARSGRRPLSAGRPIRWRESIAVGAHGDGRLIRGVLLPAEGRSWITWDPIKRQSPSRQWRRWGTDTLIRTILRAMRQFAAEHPNAPRVPIGDLSRPRGGDFGPQFGFIGHATHQNGLDVDVYYPRKDRRERPPDHPGQVDLRLAQTLVDLFVEAGADRVYVGPSLPQLTGPPGIVQPVVHHDNHLHARLPLP